MTIEGVVFVYFTLLGTRLPPDTPRGWLVDGKLMKLVVLVCIAMMLDLLTFSLAIGDVGIASEMNPVMAQAYASFGLAMVTLLKFVVTVTILLLVLRVKHPRLRLLTVIFASSIALLGVLGNLVTWSLA